MGVDNAAAIAVFEKVRDKPYVVDVLDSNFGCNCYTKAIELQPLMENLGYQARIMICHFDWRDCPFPKEILNLYDHNQETTHSWLQVREKDGDDWQDVDASWDAPMAKAGFKIAKWDGQSSAELSVKPTLRLSFEEGQSYLERVAADLAEDARYRKANKVFFDAMNEWLDGLRT